MLCGSDGYPYNINIYCGISADNNKDPLGTRVVKKMLSVIETHSQHVVFSDNFVSNYPPLHELSLIEFGRIGRPLISTSEMKKQGRGPYDYRSDGSIVFVKQNDNAIVIVGSNYHSVILVYQTSRRVKGESKKNTLQSRAIKEYSKEMGKVDLLDRLCASYRPRLKSFFTRSKSRSHLY
ncbi:hypothetical protein ILUMI_15688 [Ignelater luminosus]|uniref:PiggyBac transposable element-derived protein domain-containing protein n=1 Tax=Ignelater luminosus TaxID=2038154 RepID=A0A8K0CVZ0_IGNLU|nr:hypothetical protein ILUMI_15688 [Ignelater luminosus]